MHHTRVVHFEIPADNEERAKTFYQKAFGWDINNEVKNTVITVDVADIEATLKNVEKLGGKTVRKKEPVADMGFTAYFKDTEGNIVGLWQSARRM